MPSWLSALLTLLGFVHDSVPAAREFVSAVGELAAGHFPEHAARIGEILPSTLPTDDEAAKLRRLVDDAERE